VVFYLLRQAFKLLGFNGHHDNLCLLYCLGIIIGHREAFFREIGYPVSPLIRQYHIGDVVLL